MKIDTSKLTFEGSLNYIAQMQQYLEGKREFVYYWELKEEPWDKSDYTKEEVTKLEEILNR